MTAPAPAATPVDIPREYNAAHDLLARNLRAGRGDKIAYIDDCGTCSYAQLAMRADQCASALIGLGVHPEQRVLLCLKDTIDFPTAFLGSIKAGIVPVAVNTLLTTADYEHLLRDSRARALLVSASLLPVFTPLLGKISTLKHVVVSHRDGGSGESVENERDVPGATARHETFASLLARGSSTFEPAGTSSDDACFWLYSSGSTGRPKGTIHAHASLIQTAELYGRPILGISPHDIVFSAAKLFFAYGLGNALSFPLSVGATAILMAERPTPAAVFARLSRYRPTIFFAVPTLYSALLASLPPGSASARGDGHLRVCVSAGEALPKDIGERWVRHFGVDILDGIGSTEMLHIFLSNTSGRVRYGTTGVAVPGYQLRVVDDEGRPVPAGEIGELQVAGPTSALAYWNNREKSQHTFNGRWTRTGDKYCVNAEGCYVHAGRTDDMLKVSGIYVSPVEVEAAMISHGAVLEAAVIGRADMDGLVKPLAFVLLKSGVQPTSALAEELKQHVKAHLAPYKYPRWIEFVDELPKTATGKIQRFALRAMEAARPDSAAAPAS